MNDIIIIGGGIAGLTAAIYSKRAGLSAVVIEKAVPGGQIGTATDIENYPGTGTISGADLAAAVFTQAANAGAEVIFDEVVSIDFSDAEKRVVTASSGELIAKAVIFAGGAARRRLGVPGEIELSGRGVSYCATCDGSFFRGKHVAVVGGGNTALEDALYLANLCERVYLIHRRDRFRGEEVLAQLVQDNEKIEIILEAEVKEIFGDNTVNGITVSKKDGEEAEIELQGIFIAVGFSPDTAVLAGKADLDPSGYIIADEEGQTGVSGLFAAGDCRKKALRQAITAASDGANAANSAQSYLRKHTI